MKRLGIILFRLLRPGVVWRIPLTILAGAALLFTFNANLHETLFGYASYALSAYALTVLALGIPGAVHRVKTLLYRNEYSNRYMTDVAFRTRISLRRSLSVNLCYYVFRLLAGILYSSFWFVAVAVYYSILSLVRFLLLRHVRKGDRDLRREFREYRLCGCLLFVLDIALVGVVFQMIYGGKGYRYPGFLIYAAAAYAFYCLTTAIINAVRLRKLNNPVLSASKAISLAVAMVAMLSLQTAMFDSFGGEESFQRTMNTVSGGGVCLMIFGMAVFMVLRANRKLRTCIHSSKRPSRRRFLRRTSPKNRHRRQPYAAFLSHAASKIPRRSGISRL